MTTRLLKNVRTTRKFLKNAYSPYSKFNVSSMLYSSKYKAKFMGVNVEDITYSLTQHSEANAISSMITSGFSPKNIDYIITVTDTADTIVPCGACRQMLSEHFTKEFVIYTIGNNNELMKCTLGDLLPNIFDIP